MNTRNSATAKAVALHICAIVLAIGTISLGASSVSKPAPSISLPDLKGAMVSLDSFRGRVVLVDIWASWCPPCKEAFPAYDALYRSYRNKGFEVLAVNVDDHRNPVDAFLKGREFEMKVLVDPQGRAPSGFNLRAMPTSYLVDKKGTIRFSHEGYTEKLLSQYKNEIEQLIAEAP